VSKFIPKHKEDLSSQLNSEGLTKPEPESPSDADSDDRVEQDAQEQPKSQPLLLARGKRGAAIALNGLKSVSGFIIKPFTGPRPLHHRYWFWVGLGVTGGAIALSYSWYELEKSIPNSTADVLTFVRKDTLTIKAADGTIIQQIGPATRDTVKYREAPKLLIQAYLATEDRRFQEHHGVDYQGIARAVLSNLQAGGVVEGGSTITQQLARIVYFDQAHSLTRKLKEMRMAQKIERDIEKDKILERYLNLVYLGSGAYGVTDAAWVYFSKPVKDLTLPEMAMLAGLPAAPSDYSPFVNAKVAKERRDVVLRRMQENGFITAAQAQEAIATPLNTKRSNPKRLNRKANYFSEYIQQELPKYVSKEVLAEKGLTIETTLNADWQVAAEKAVKDAVELDGRSEGFEQAALVAIDPRTGQIKAMVGGKDFYNQQFNRVTQAQRQPGSTFKTFVYSTAMAAGISPNRGYLDAPFTVDGYSPNNYNDKYRGWMNIRDALTSSLNVVAVKTLIDVGWDTVVDVAKKMGIESKLNPTYSLALGSSEVNLLELTSAYGTLAAEGVHTKPHGIRRIRDRRGKVIYEENFKGERAIDKESAAIMTWMLRSVVTDGTGRAAQLGRPVAGKTGTSDEARDLWFVGYIPQVVAGVWLGNDNNKPTNGRSGTAAYTWHKFMVKVVDKMKTEPFPERPKDIEKRKGTIKIKPIKPKRAEDKAPSRSESTSESSSRSNRSYDNGDYNRDYGSGASEDSGTEYRSSRQRRYSEESYTEPEPERSYYRRREPVEEPAPQYSEPRYSEPRQEPSYSEPSYSEPSYSEPRRSSRRQETYEPAPEAPQPAAPPPVEQKFEPAPAAAPPDPPAARKAPEPPPEAAPVAPAPPPEPPAPAAAQ
jgi:penicillin-binding protein 1A